MSEDAEDIEKRNQKRFDWFTKVIIPVALFVLGYFVKYGYDYYTSRLRVIRYAPVVSPALLTKPDLGGKQLQLTLDGKPIDNLSSVTIHLFNDDEDLEKLPIYVAFPPVDGQQPKLIYARPKLASEAYKEIPAAADGSVKVGYEIVVLNRNTTFQIDCLFEGEHPPTPTVYTLTKGVKTELTTLQSETETMLKLNQGGIFITLGQSALAVVIISLIPLALSIVNKKRYESRYKHSDHIERIADKMIE